MKKSSWIIGLSILSLFAYSCGPGKAPAPGVSEKIPVQVIQVKKVTRPRMIMIQGVITPVEEVIRSKVPGKVCKVYVHKGQEVECRQVLIGLELGSMVRKVQKAGKNAAQSEAKWDQDLPGDEKEKIAAAEKELQRAEKGLNRSAVAYLQTRQQTGSALAAERSWENLSSRYDGTLARYQEAAERVELLKRYAAKRYVDQAEEPSGESPGSVPPAKPSLKKALVRAPFKGLITERYIAGGSKNFITPRTALLKLADPSRMKIEASIAAQDLAELQSGMAGEIRVNAFPGEIFPAQVTRLMVSRYPAGVSKVELEIPNPQLRLADKAVADIRLTGGNQNFLTIPQANLLTDPKTGNFYTYVAVGDQAIRRRLTLGSQNGTWVDVLDGLQEGDLVVVKAPSLLHGGEKIKVSKVMAKEVS